MGSLCTTIAIDFGASSGRAIIGSYDGNRLKIEELSRFENQPVSIGGHLYWDVLRLFYELKNGLRAAHSKGIKPISIGVDTWGVDFGLLGSNGELLSNPLHYRDTLTDGEIERVSSIVEKKEIYKKTGVQFLKFNTLYQLHALYRTNPCLMQNVKSILLMPDLFNYFLTGEKAAEYSMASTTQMLAVEKRDWDYGLLEKLNISASCLESVIQPGRILGKMLPENISDTGINAPVSLVCGHDTGSAVLAVPMKKGEKSAYLSCGTWSLLGVELDEPRVDDRAFKIDYTNEGGFGGSIRFLKNIIGLWIYQQLKSQFEQKEGHSLEYSVLDAETLATPAFASLIDPDDESFLSPGNMKQKIDAYCHKTGQPKPDSRGAYLRCVLESLALKYRININELEDYLGYRFELLRAVGGGCKNYILMEMTANALAKPVYAGPAEATAIGNICAQLIATGEIRDRWQVRKIIEGSFQPIVYLPKNIEAWESQTQRFKDIIKTN